MNEEPKRAPLWPKLIIFAFVAGGILWVFWMMKFIRQTRANKVDSYFVPTNTHPEPIYQNHPSVPAPRPAEKQN